MEVAIVTPRYPPTNEGGGERSVSLLAEQLDRSERVEEVVVFSFDGTTTSVRNGVTVRRLKRLSPTVTELQNIRALRPLGFRIDEFDLVHAYNMELHPVVGALGDRHDVPTVATLNSYHFLPKSVARVSPGTVERLYEIVGHPTTGRVLMHFHNRNDRFVALSSAVRDIYADYGVDPGRCEVVPNMIDPGFADRTSVDGATGASSGETPGGTAGDRTRVLFVGELSRQKGVQELVRSVPDLSERFSVRVVGDGPRAAALERLARNLGVDDRVEFVGFVDYEDVHAEYAAADVFVHPGIWPEPFGRTLLEAMQYGLPVVCTDIGGPADIVPDPEFRCQPGDAQALAAAIERVSATDRDIGARNREYVHDEFSADAVTTQILEIYEDLVA